MTNANRHIIVDLQKQQLMLYSDEQLLKIYPVSTAKNGPGEMMDSECTPRGYHVIAEKIGRNSADNTVFVGRQATGEIYEPAMRVAEPERDWILTRIMWLRGQEPGINLDGNVDSYDRYIYIHGTPEDVDMSVAGSRGCIRLRNHDIIELFEDVAEGTSVVIQD